jgi:hypothetical protein
VAISTSFSLPIPIAAPYSTVTYEFFTEGGDINFSVIFIGFDNVEQVIHEPKRVVSDEENIYASCQIDCPGTLIFVWDNTYSWFNNKLLTYAVEIQQVASHASPASPRLILPPPPALSSSRMISRALSALESLKPRRWWRSWVSMSGRSSPRWAM